MKNTAELWNKLNKGEAITLVIKMSKKFKTVTLNMGMDNYTVFITKVNQNVETGLTERVEGTLIEGLAQEYMRTLIEDRGYEPALMIDNLNVLVQDGNLYSQEEAVEEGCLVVKIQNMYALYIYDHVTDGGAVVYLNAYKPARKLYFEGDAELVDQI